MTRSLPCRSLLIVIAIGQAAPASASREGLEHRPLTRLNNLDRRIGELVRRRQELDELREDIEFELERAGQRLAKSREEADNGRAVRLRRLAVLRRNGRLLQAGMLLGPRSRRALVDRQFALSAVAAHDRRLAQHHVDESGALAAATQQGDSVRRRLNALAESLSALERSLTEGRADRTALLEAVARDPRIARRATAELQAGRARLAAGFDAGAAPAALPPELPLALGKGRLPMPVRGEVVRDFGAQRKGRWGPSVRNEGIDITAPMGAEVRAVWGGKVSFADWLPGFGLVVIVAHGQGWHTVYGHLRDNTVSPGARVAAGDPLGGVGATGTWDAPHLHFEVRQGKAPKDPADWLAVR